LQIVPLAERPEFVDQVGAWGFAEWGHLDPGQTLQSRTAGLRAKMSAGPIPIAFVALDQSDGIVGTASLVFDDLKGDPRNPWLASVFVPPAQRRKGVASALIGTVESAAQRLGCPKLYLFTTSAGALYAGLGWRALEQRDYRGEHIQVMDKAL
jgi:GNAT superfamily N-acetyltransferase